MSILGIDPGSVRTGYGIVRLSPTGLSHVAHGVIQAGSEGLLPRRLQTIYDSMREVMARYRPDSVAVEAIFHARNPRSSLMLGHARGAVILAAVHDGLEVFEYSALQIKQALTGYGRAEKDQLRAMVRAVLGVKGRLPSDASDALAVAICHANSHALNERLRSNA